MADIKFLVEVDSKKGTAVIKELDKNIEQLEKTGKKTGLGMKNLWIQFGVGMAAAQGVIRSLRGVISFMKETVRASAEQERAG